MAVFDEAFLESRLKKQAEWRKKGVKTGAGGIFSDVVDVSKRSHQQKTLDDMYSAKDLIETPLTETPLVVKTDGLPCWLTQIINSDTEIQRALANKKYKPDSPHKQALIELSKKPELYKRNVEHYIQVRLFYIVERDHPQFYPAMKAVPNGGLRSKLTAHKLRCEGQKAGAPDIDIDYPRGIYHGMKLEVKSEKGKLQDNQIEALSYFNQRGYYAVMGKGFDDCYFKLLAYFRLPEFDNSTKIAA